MQNISINESKEIPGIYCIKNNKNDKIYIGSTVSIKTRLIHHRSELRNNKHPNRHLQNSWNNYGENYFLFFIVEESSENLLLERESYWINFLKSNEPDKGYNCRDANRAFFDKSHRTELNKNKYVERLKEIISKYKGKLPNCHSKDKQEKNDALWIWHRKTGIRWLEELQKIATELGFENFFKIKNNEQIAINRLEKIISRYSAEKLPSQHSKIEAEKSDGVWINNMRKNKKNKNSRWYPILEIIAKSKGFSDLFTTGLRKYKLNQELAIKIRIMHKNGVPQNKISKIMKISSSTVNSVIKNRTWKVDEIL